MSIDNAVFKEIHTNKNQHYIFPTVTPPPLTPIDNQLIFNDINHKNQQQIQLWYSLTNCTTKTR